MSAPRSNLDLSQLKLQAKELLRSYQRGEEQALQRIQASHPKFVGAEQLITLALVDTQLVIARENGFPSWPT